MTASLFFALTACATPAQTTGLVVGTVLGATAVGAYKVGPEIQQVYYLGVYDPDQQIPTQVYRVTVHGQASFISGATFASGWVPASVIDSLDCRIEAANPTFPDRPNAPLIVCGEAQQLPAPSEHAKAAQLPAADKAAQKDQTPSVGARDQDKQDTPTPARPPAEPIKPPTDSKPGDRQNVPSMEPDAPSRSLASGAQAGTSRVRMFTLGPEGVRESPRDHRLVIVMGSSADKFFEAIDQVLGDSARQRKPPPLTAAQKERLVNELREADLAQIHLEDLRAQTKKDLSP